jgi:hypothetical protein
MNHHSRSIAFDFMAKFDWQSGDTIWAVLCRPVVTPNALLS